MSVAAGKGQLTLATRQLEARWAETRFSWRDRKAAEFEEHYLAELSAAVNAAMRAIDELALLLENVRADCD